MCSLFDCLQANSGVFKRKSRLYIIIWFIKTKYQFNFFDEAKTYILLMLSSLRFQSILTLNNTCSSHGSCKQETSIFSSYNAIRSSFYSENKRTPSNSKGNQLILVLIAFGSKLLRFQYSKYRIRFNVLTTYNKHSIRLCRSMLLSHSSFIKPTLTYSVIVCTRYLITI